MAIGSLAIAFMFFALHGEALHTRKFPETRDDGGLEIMLEAEDGAETVALSDIFCWAVMGPSDSYLVDLARSNLEQCGNYAVLTNYSVPEQHLVKVFDGNMETGLTPGGWANNTDLFTHAWDFIARSNWPHHHKWFVKVDMDTFFRPRSLPFILSKFNPSQPVALMQDGRIRGALEVMSGSSFLHPNSWMIYTQEAHEASDPYLGGEDVWLGKAFRKAGFRLAETSFPGKCKNFLLTYYNLPDRLRDTAVNTPGKARNLPVSLLKAACKPDGGIDYSEGNCVSDQIVAMHPVKDLSVYQDFMAAEDDCHRW